VPTTSLIILGALPWRDPAPIRAARWSDLARARPILAATDSDPFADHPALVAAYHALTHRVSRVLLFDPSDADPGALTRMTTAEDAVLVCDDLTSPGVASALIALFASSATHPCFIAAGQPWPPAFAARGVQPVVVSGGGTFTPPGRFKAYPLSASALAAPLLLGAVSQLGAMAALVDESRHTRPATHGLRLFADVRGVIRLSGTIPARASGETAATEPTPRDPDAAIFRSLERILSAKVEAHAFTRLAPVDAKSAVERELRPILAGALKRGDIDAFTLEVSLEGDQLLVDARVRAPRRVKTVQLRLAPLERPNP